MWVKFTHTHRLKDNDNFIKKAEIYINFYTGKIAEYEDKINDLRRCNNGTGQTKKVR